jgi:ssRNA-specific RNase YbeY (16S rRNA maturation enzyme)
VQRKAIEQDRSLSFHLMTLLAHSVCHLLGYEHEQGKAMCSSSARTLTLASSFQDSDWRLMLLEEQRILDHISTRRRLFEKL